MLKQFVIDRLVTAIIFHTQILIKKIEDDWVPSFARFTKSINKFSWSCGWIVVAVVYICKAKHYFSLYSDKAHINFSKMYVTSAN